MPAGFSAYTDTGYIQITEAYSNLTFKQKITVSTPGGTGLGGTAVNGTFTVSSVNSPVLAFRTTGYVTLDQVTVSGSNWTYRILHTGTSVDVYVFDYPNYAQSPGSFGLQVFKADGSLAFDSTMKYARIDLVQAPAGPFPTWNGVWPPNTNQTASVTANSGRTYAVALSYIRSGSIIVASGGTDQYQILVDGVSINGATASMAMMRTAGSYWVDQGSGPGWDYYRQSAPPPILFFDVTGL